MKNILRIDHKRLQIIMDRTYAKTLKIQPVQSISTYRKYGTIIPTILLSAKQSKRTLTWIDIRG